MRRKCKTNSPPETILPIQTTLQSLSNNNATQTVPHISLPRPIFILVMRPQPLNSKIIFALQIFALWPTLHVCFKGVEG